MGVVNVNMRVAPNTQSFPPSVPFLGKAKAKFSANDKAIGMKGAMIWVNGQFAKKANPAELPAGIGRCATFSPDGRYLAVAHYASLYITIYDMSSGVPVKLANPATLPTGQGNGAAFSPNGRYLVIAHAISPYITIYDMSSGVPVKLANPATLPTGYGFGAAFSPDGRYLAIAHETSPFVTIYDMSSGKPVKLANPAALPTGNGYGTSFSSDGRYLAVVHDTTPFVTIYESGIRDSDTVIPMTYAAIRDNATSTLFGGMGFIRAPVNIDEIATVDVILDRDSFLN